MPFRSPGTFVRALSEHCNRYASMAYNANCLILRETRGWKSFTHLRECTTMVNGEKECPPLVRNGRE